MSFTVKTPSAVCNGNKDEKEDDTTRLFSVASHSWIPTRERQAGGEAESELSIDGVGARR